MDFPPSDFAPGLLNLELSINKVKLVDTYAKQAKCKLELLKYLSETSPDRPHTIAIRHLIAVFEFHLGEENEAIQQLENIQEDDSDNLNVLADLATVYSKHFRKDDEAECLEKSKSIRENSSNESRLAIAKSLAGQGLAWGFDLHVETRSTDRLDRSIKLYKHALKIAGNLLGINEKDDWFHYLALDYVRRNNLKRIKEVKEYYEDSLVKALECIEPNIHSKDKIRQSAALCLLGTLFTQRPPNFADFASLVKEDLKPYWKHPEKCFQESLKANNQNFIALNQLARRYYFTDKKEDKALKCLNDSLQIKKCVSNHHAFRTRALIHRNKYNKQVLEKGAAEKHNQKEEDATKHLEVTMPDKNLLRQAMDDLKMCMKYDPYVLDIIHLAEVCHKLARKGPHNYDKKLLHQALSYCSVAEKCQDGAMRSDLHHQRALILQDLGDPNSAIQCFMQAMDCENPGTTNNRNFVFMFNGLLKRYHQAQVKPKHLLQQLVYWLEEGLIKYAHTNIKISKFVTDYTHEMMAILEVLSDSKERKTLNLAIQCVKAFKDAQVDCDKAKLASIDKKVSHTVGECVDRLENPKSPSSRAVMKAKMQDLTLDVQLKKKLEVEFQETEPNTGTSQKEQQQRLASQETSSDTVTHSEVVKDTRQETSSESTTAAETQDHQEHLLGNQNVADVKLHASDAALPPEQQSGHITITQHVDEQQSGDDDPVDDVFTPSQIPQISPESNPLTRYVQSLPKTSTPVSQGEQSNTSLSSHGASPLTPENTSESMLSTPSTADSFTLGLNLSTLNKDVRKFFTFPTEVHHRDIIDAVLRTLEDSDLRLHDIAGPPEKALHPDFKYDFYVVYNGKCEKTSDFVYYHLRSQLEEGTRPLKGCIQERDFQLGVSIIKNMERAIEDSAKILLLISTGFFQNGWCEQAFTLAIDPDTRHKVIPILLAHETLPKALKNIHYYDATKTINWGLIRRNLEPPGSPCV